MYEIFAEEEPWKGISNVEAAQNILSGKLLLIPDTTPSMIKALMIMCWNKDGNNRIVAEEIVRILQQKGPYGEIPSKVFTIGNYNNLDNINNLKNYEVLPNSLNIQRTQYDGPPARISDN